VESQRSEAGDLSDAASTAEELEPAGSDTAGSDTAGSDTAETGTVETGTVREPSAARKWLTDNKIRVQLVSSVALFVAAGAFAGAMVQPYLAGRATVANKEKIARTAADAIATLWSYTPDDMDTLSDRSAKYLGGEFGQQYRRYVDAIAPTNKQAKVTSATQVVAAAVESVRGSEATALVYTNTTSTSPQSNNIPSLKYLSYRLELQREGRDWRVTKMSTVTSLDLTPKL